jgi:TatD DNase family protein
MSFPYVDFHCHLDLYPDFVSAIADAERAGVYTLTVTTTPKAWQRNHELTRRTRCVRAAIGLHPQLVHERSHEIALWEELLPETRYVGEVGLDAGPRYFRSIELQKKIFEHVLKACARAGGKILTVHSVRSAKSVLDLIEAHLPRDRGRAVMHWFTGSKSEARRAVELGCYFSINSQMLLGDRGRDLFITLPQDRILTETDGPFTKIGNRPALPIDVRNTVESIAALKGTTAEQITAQIRENLKRLLESSDARPDQ